jgi:hypothetical protein
LFLCAARWLSGWGTWRFFGGLLAHCTHFFLLQQKSPPAFVPQQRKLAQGVKYMYRIIISMRDR